MSTTLTLRHPALRLGAYLQERFPPAATALFIALFFTSAATVSVALGDGSRIHWAGAAVMLLLFFRLRVADDHKDFVQDRHEHPDRLLSRGVITLTELAWVSRAALLVEALLVLTIGARAAVAWLACSIFLVLMRWEFGIGPWLRRHVVLYAIAHNPIIALLACFAAACTDARLTPALAGYLLFASLAALGYELGRKSAEYAAALGRHRALLVRCAVTGASAAALSVVLGVLGTLSSAWALLPAALFVLLARVRPSAAGSGFLTLAFGVAIVAALR